MRDVYVGYFAGKIVIGKMLDRVLSVYKIRFRVVTYMIRFVIFMQGVGSLLTRNHSIVAGCLYYKLPENMIGFFTYV